MKLMTPGPTNVPSLVRDAISKPMIHHRTPEFKNIFSELTENLKYVFKTKNDVLILTSSGTGGMEAAVCNFFSSGDKVIVCNNGKFGERFVEICKRYGLDVIELKYELGEAAKPSDIKNNLDSEIKGVFVTQSETSTGICNDIKEIGNIVKKTNALLIVDSISALGSVDMRTDDWEVDVVIAASQKALMGPPGLCFISVSEKAWEAYKKSNLPKYYFDLGKYKKKLQEKETPYTPAISLIIGMNESLKFIREIGIDNFLKKHEKISEKLRRGLIEIGFEIFPRSGLKNNGLTVVKSLPGIDSSVIINAVKEHGYVIANGQEELKGKVFRIATMGDVEEKDIDKMLDILKTIVKKFA